MENRRQTYRHAFDPEEAVRVQLRMPGRPDAVDCELLDLSLGGMRVRLRPAPPLRAGDWLVSRLLGREGPAPVELSLALPCTITHVEPAGDAVVCGVAFLPTVNPGANEHVERILGRFLMAEQRRLARLRRQHEEGERPA